mmetsp:Transcript_101001/g.240697  ORF Transcript_101001/g.240697 Transcript_101001/m.240697 type:complete len:181 (+) Transcript_101001:68-610(+)
MDRREEMVREPQASRGSKNHHKGQCNPCRDHPTAAGCKDGHMCNFCHMPHSQEWLARAAELREERKAQGRRARQAAEAPRYYVCEGTRGGCGLAQGRSATIPNTLAGRREPGQMVYVPEVPERRSKFERAAKGHSTQKGKLKGRAVTAETQRWLDSTEGSARDSDETQSSIIIHGGPVQI